MLRLGVALATSACGPFNVGDYYVRADVDDHSAWVKVSSVNQGIYKSVRWSVGPYPGLTIRRESRMEPSVANRAAGGEEERFGVFPDGRGGLIFESSLLPED